MELQGKIIAALEPRTGESQRGPWKVQSFVLETHDAYPRKMVFDVFGEDRLNRFNIQVGQEVSVSFDIDAHEYQGRWFNSVRAFDVRQVPAGAPAANPFAPAPTAPNAGNDAAPSPQANAPQAGVEDNSEDDLPF